MASATNTSKHEQISTYVRNYVRSRGLKPGDAIMTEQELARMFNCSRGTVQHALTMLVGEGLIHRRRGSGSFVTEQNQAVQRRRIVFAIWNLANTFIARFSHALNVGITERGYHMVLSSADGRKEKDLAFLDQLQGPDLLGLIRFPSWVQSELETRDMIRAMGIRHVVINDFWTDCWRDNHVAYDERAGMDLAVAHLAQLGHRIIAYVDWKVASLRVNAMNAFKEAMKRHDLPCDDEELFIYDIFVEGERPPLERLYGPGRPCPTALVTPYESIANSIVGVLNEIGLRVPDDVSVACLNGPGKKSDFGSMDFTTSVPPTEKMVDVAIKILTDDSSDRITQHCILAPDFHVGRTSAPPRKNPR